MNLGSANARVQLVGAFILVVGFILAAVIWVQSERAESRTDSGEPSLLDSRKQVRQLEVMEGQSGVVFEQWTEALKTLFHGKKLAALVVFCSTTLALIFFFAAGHVVALIEAIKTPSPEA